VVAKLRDEYVAGRLSHDTFLHRVNVVLESRQQADLPPLVADLPASGRATCRMNRPIRETLLPASAPLATQTGEGVRNPDKSAVGATQRDAG